MHSKAWQFRKNANTFDLETTDRSLPESPPPGALRIKIHAASLNYRDIIAWQNLAGRNVDGRIPCSDGAGEIVSRGEGCDSWDIGDRVAGCFFLRWQSGPFDLSYHKQDLGGNIDGMLQQVIDLPATGVVGIPSHLTYEQGSTLPCAGLTAWYSLVTRGKLREGETVLCIGTGGVSIFALQFAKALGARPIVLSSSNQKLRRAADLGAWKTINYKESPNWSDLVWELTERRGVDHVVEVGGPGTLEQSLKSVAAGGQIALIGVLTGFGPPTTSLFPLLARNVRLDGIYVGSRENFLEMNQFIARENLEPVIDHVFDFDQAPIAFEALRSAKHFGKVVVRIP